MKILLVSEFFPIGKDLRFSGGVEARTYYLAKHLTRFGHEVIVLTSKLKEAPQKESLSGFKIFRVGSDRSYTATVGDVISRIKFAISAIKVGKGLDCEIVDGSNFITHFIAKRISLSKKIPSVAWYPDVWLGSWIKNAGIFGILGEILERFNLASRFDAYIPISKSTAKKLPRQGSANIQIIPCGVEKDEFKNPSKKPKKLTIICVSRLAKYKNVKDLILSFALVSKKIEDAKLVIVGTGPEYENLNNLIKNLKLDQKIKFMANVPRQDLIELYQTSTIFCSPSAVEGFGISTVEALAAQTPYVVTDIEVFKEITKNGRGGLIFKLGDIKDLASKLERLLSDKSLYKRKQLEGMNLAKNYTWQKIAKKTEKLYLDLIGNRQSKSLR